MKYAFVVLIVIYLITYGCSSNEQKPATESGKKAETITVENTPPAPPTVAAEQAQAPGEQVQPVAAEAPAEQPVVAQQPEKAATEPQPPEAVADTTEQQMMPDDQDSLFVNPEDLVVMPCGRAFLREDASDLPCMQQQEGPMMQEEPAMPQALPGQPSGDPQDELTAAMQNMVQATNAMVSATRQMALATEEMVKATRKARGESSEPGQNSPEATAPNAVEQPAQPAQPNQPAQPAQPAPPAGQPQAQAPVSTPSPEQALVESLQEVVIAAQAVVDETNKAISRTQLQPHHQ